MRLVAPHSSALHPRRNCVISQLLRKRKSRAINLMPTAHCTAITLTTLLHLSVNRPQPARATNAPQGCGAKEVMIHATLRLRLEFDERQSVYPDGLGASVTLVLAPDRAGEPDYDFFAFFPRENLSLDIVALAESLAAPGSYYI